VECGADPQGKVIRVDAIIVTARLLDLRSEGGIPAPNGPCNPVGTEDPVRGADDAKLFTGASGPAPAPVALDLDVAQDFTPQALWAIQKDCPARFT